MALHRRTGRALVAVILAKLALVAVVVLLPAGLAVSLGAAHAVVVAVALVAGAAVTLLYRRHRFAPGWQIDPVTPAPLVSGHGDLKGWLVSVTRQETQTLSARAEVPTDRAGRYIDQLCRHAEQMHRADWRHAPSGAEAGVRVERTADGATVHIGTARCVLRTTPDALIVVAEASDETSLRRVQDIVGADLVRFGRRAGLTVTWTG